jgi:HPt (histidine-containing phosphotransfer) domain-containing protein
MAEQRIRETSAGENPRRGAENSAPLSSGATDDDSRGKVFNRSALLARIGGHGEMIQRFVDMFLESVEACLPKLEQAISAQDLEAVRKVAHTLKGVSGNIGADRIHAVVLDMGARARAGDVEGLRTMLAELHGEYVLFRAAANLKADEVVTPP